METGRDGVFLSHGKTSSGSEGQYIKPTLPLPPMLILAHFQVTHFFNWWCSPANY